MHSAPGSHTVIISQSDKMSADVSALDSVNVMRKIDKIIKLFISDKLLISTERFLNIGEDIYTLAPAEMKVAIRYSLS